MHAVSGNKLSTERQVSQMVRVISWVETKKEVDLKVEEGFLWAGEESVPEDKGRRKFDGDQYIKNYYVMMI